MIDSNYVLSINLKPLVELFQNNQFIFIAGGGSIVLAMFYGIARLIKVVSEHKREKFKILLPLKMEAFDNTKILIKTFKNVIVTQILSSLEDTSISKEDLNYHATIINNLFNTDKKKFSENKALFGKKSTSFILKEHKKYKEYFMKNIPKNMLENNLTREMVQEQFSFYLDFNKALTQELDNVERRLSKELGICD